MDAGESTLVQLLRSNGAVRLSKVTRIFITHMHGDHVWGLPGKTILFFYIVHNVCKYLIMMNVQAFDNLSKVSSLSSHMHGDHVWGEGDLPGNNIYIYIISCIMNAST